MPHRLTCLVLAAAACTTPQRLPATPDCTFSGAFEGGVQGDLTIVDARCQGKESGGFSGGSFIDDEWWVDVTLEQGLVFSEGATFDDVDALVGITDRSTKNHWSSLPDMLCSADVDDVVFYETAFDPKRFVSGTVQCDSVLSRRTGNDAEEDVTLAGTATFLFELF